MIASSMSVLLYQALRKFLKVATSYYPPYKNIYLFAVLELWLIVYRLAGKSEPPNLLTQVLSLRRARASAVACDARRLFHPWMHQYLLPLFFCHKMHCMLLHAWYDNEGFIIRQVCTIY